MCALYLAELFVKQFPTAELQQSREGFIALTRVLRARAVVQFPIWREK